ncbi:MAG: AAA family ATPase [Intestinibacter sp.]|uniref:ATP-binding protein n=1 Tax=Intestinibacter sp. TaxID=1965304 RepID=UPI002A7F9472|nr:AAA family ATPase [Intestinibacter sp.]MDY4575005.1 AAA family ATPase [Intestinibacter sp.]
MAHVVAVAGKGGVGKTTLTSLIIKYLCENNKTPILAVDADANANLDEVLGVKSDITLGQIREEMGKTGIDTNIPKNVTKREFFEMKLNDAIIEEDDFDLMVMGRSQGEGCYCFVNSVLQSQIKKLQNNYKYIIVDNEAGMEHISRGILPKIDTMILVSDCSRRGVQATGRISELIKECNINPGRIGLIVNRAPNGELSEGTKEEIDKQGLELLGVIPHDNAVYEYDCDGKPMISLPEDSPVKKSLQKIISEINL